MKRANELGKLHQSLLLKTERVFGKLQNFL